MVRLTPWRVLWLTALCWLLGGCSASRGAASSPVEAGTPREETAAPPLKAKGPAVKAIAAGSHHSVALLRDGTVWAWGSNGVGQLGRGAPPRGRVTGLSGVKALASGHHHAVALKGDGTVWAWGSNAEGQLGDGTFNFAKTPVQVLGLDN